MINRRSLLCAGLSILPGGCFLGRGTSATSSDGGGDAGGDAPDLDAADGTMTDLDADAAPSCAPGACTLDGNTLILPFAQHPQLAQVGGSVLVEDSRYHDPVCGQDFVMVAHPTAGTYVAFQGSCTHSCCAITFTGSAFFCPCHSSTFDLDGQVVSGPAPLALERLPVCANGCGVFVQLA